MKSLEFDDTQTGWVQIPGDTEIIVAHYKDGHKESMNVFSFVTETKKRHQCVKIECYSKGETVKGGEE